MDFVGLTRRMAGWFVPYAVAGAVWFPLSAALSRLLPDPTLQLVAETAAELVFVITGLALVLAAWERDSDRQRRQAGDAVRVVDASRDDLAREIAARAAAEEALRRCRGQLRDLGELAGEWFWETGPDLRLADVTAGYAEATGQVLHTARGRPAMELFAGSGVAVLRNALADRAAVADLSLMLVVGDGERPVTLTMRPHYEPNGLFAGFRGCVRDDRARAAERQDANLLRQRYEMVLAAIDEGVLGFDADGRVLFANAAAVEMLGWNAGQMAELSTAELAEPEDGRLAGDVAAEVRVRRLGISFRRKDGTALPVDYLCLPSGGGGAVIAFRGVTERLRTERELLEAKEAAERSTQAKSDFLAAMSHELRTPLNAIMGFADLILGELFGPIGNDRYKEYVGDIRASGQHVAAIIDDVLDLSRIEANRLELDERPVDVAQVVEESLAMVRTEAVRTGVSIGNNVPGNLPPVRADARRLRQVLINLTANAVRFTPAGGRVEVSAEIDGEGGLVLRVVDTGVGIPAEELPKVTQVFVQGNLAVSRRHGGAGLGLPIAKHLVELHGGKLTIDSVVQHGTTVTVRLPPSRLVTEAELMALGGNTA